LEFFPSGKIAVRQNRRQAKSPSGNRRQAIAVKKSPSRNRRQEIAVKKSPSRNRRHVTYLEA
jgi:hypothetical protein